MMANSPSVVSEASGDEDGHITDPDQSEKPQGRRPRGKNKDWKLFHSMFCDNNELLFEKMVENKTNQC